MAENLVELNEQNFDSTVGSSGAPVLVDFWAPWCGPCRSIAPILKELATEMGDKLTVGKVNVDDNQALAAKFQVRAIPTMLLFKGGEVVDQIVGLTSKDDLKQKVEALAPA